MKANDTSEVIPVALRDSMRESAAPYLRPGEPIQAVIGAQTASQWLAALTGFFVFLGLILNVFSIALLVIFRSLFVCFGWNTATGRTNINSTAFSAPAFKDKILQVVWAGARYDVTDAVYGSLGRR